MQTLGPEAATQRVVPSRPWWAAAVLALTVAIAAALLVVGGRTALPSDPAKWTPLETAQRFNDLYEQGRVAEFQALISPRATWCLDIECSQASPFFDSIYDYGFQTAHESQFLAATRGTLGAECIANGSAVDCEWHQTNVFFEVGGIDPWVGLQSFHVENGVITRYTGGYRYEGVLVYDRVQQNQYSQWLEAEYPDEHAILFEDQLMLVFTQEARDRHRHLVEEWAASLGF